MRHCQINSSPYRWLTIDWLWSMRNVWMIVERILGLVSFWKKKIPIKYGGIGWQINKFIPKSHCQWIFNGIIEKNWYSYCDIFEKFKYFLWVQIDERVVRDSWSFNNWCIVKIFFDSRLTINLFYRTIKNLLFWLLIVIQKDM